MSSDRLSLILLHYCAQRDPLRIARATADVQAECLGRLLTGHVMDAGTLADAVSSAAAEWPGVTRAGLVDAAAALVEMIALWDWREGGGE